MQFELTKEFISEISNAINKGDSHFIVSHVNELHPADIA